MTERDTVLRQAPELTVEAFEDAVLVWDPARRMLHRLDLAAATVWERLDGRTLGQIAAELAAEVEADERLVRRDVLTLGDTLLTQGLATREVRSDSHAFGRGPDRDTAN